LASSLHRAFLSSSLGTAISRVLGLLRELAMANALGAGVASDAFTTAFTIPGVFRRFMADEGLSGALVPEVADAEAKDGTEEARRVAGRTLSALLIVGVLLCVVSYPLAPQLVSLFAEGFKKDPEKFALTVQLTRWMMPFVITVSVVSWAESLLNIRDRFFVPKLAPAVVSAAMIVGALWPGQTDPFEIVYSISYAVLVGGVLHAAICIPSLVKAWGRIRPRFDWASDPRFMHLLREMGKVALIGLTAQANIIVLRRVASFLEDGAPTHYWYATRLVDVAQGVIAVGVGSALMPAIARAVAGSDWRAFRASFVGSARLVAALLIPIAVYLAFLSEPVVAVLFRHGKFSMADVAPTADALELLIPYMIALASIQLLKKPFFAFGDRTPLIIVAIMGVLLTGVLGYQLGTRYGVGGLAAGLSISAVAQAFAYSVLLYRRVRHSMGAGEITGFVIRVVLASAPSAVLALVLAPLGTWDLGPTLWNMALLAGIGVLGGASYLLMARVLGVAEAQALVRAVTRRFRR